MSEKHLYLSLIPQALVASMLAPAEFGRYYATGSKVHIQGEAIFFELDPDYRSPDFPFDLMASKCVAKADGRPKKSVYLGIYRVLSRIPVSALGNLYLVTSDGRTLELRRGDYQRCDEGRLHLYQELCPVNPMVASRLVPSDFCRFITDARQPIHVPRIVFTELLLHGLATDPRHGYSGDLPYRNIEHLRDCLQEISVAGKASKMVLKQVDGGVFYRMIDGGFYVGDARDFAYYPLPPRAELETTHRQWWRSACSLPFVRY